MKELHWYSFTFHFCDPVRTGFANAYVGFEDNLVTLARIEEARIATHIPKGIGSVLTSVNYLGCMAKDYFTGK